MNEKIAEIYRSTPTKILGFFDDHRWLSNFHKCDVEYLGIFYNSSETAYQAQKLEPIYREDFSKLNGKESKKESRKIVPPKDWYSIKTQHMYYICLDKFTRNKDLSELLIETGDRYLEETNYWKDTFWGVCDGIGENMLGKILMNIRSLLNGKKEEYLIFKKGIDIF